MTDKLSEVALALWDAGPENQDPLGVILVEYFDGYTVEEIRTLVLPLYAKAAIEAYRVPTDGMVKAAARLLVEATKEYAVEPDVDDITDALVSRMLRKAADAALEGK